MKFLLMIILSFAIAAPAYAKKTFEKEFHSIEDWNSFDRLMLETEQQNRIIGWSYILSGVLVVAGSTVGAQNATDDGSQIAFGITSAFGIGAVSYGSLLLLNGNQHAIFYNTIRQSNLTPEQRNELIRNYLKLEAERERLFRINRMVTNFVISGLSFYSASQADDKNTKTFFQVMGAASFAIALSYTF